MKKTALTILCAIVMPWQLGVNAAHADEQRHPVEPTQVQPPAGMSASEISAREQNHRMMVEQRQETVTVSDDEAKRYHGEQLKFQHEREQFIREQNARIASPPVPAEPPAPILPPAQDKPKSDGDDSHIPPPAADPAASPAPPDEPPHEAAPPPPGPDPNGPPPPPAGRERRTPDPVVDPAIVTATAPVTQGSVTKPTVTVHASTPFHPGGAVQPGIRAAFDPPPATAAAASETGNNAGSTSGSSSTGSSSSGNASSSTGSSGSVSTGAATASSSSSGGTYHGTNSDLMQNARNSIGSGTAYTHFDQMTDQRSANSANSQINT